MIKLKKIILVANFIFIAFILSSYINSYAQNFEVRHADSLEILDQFIDVNGNIVINYKDAIIEAPKGRIETGEDGKPKAAVFTGRAMITLNDRELEADKITFKIDEETVIADGETLSRLKDKNGKLITIRADYQKLFWNGNDAEGKGNIITHYEDIKVLSDEVKVLYKENKPDEAIFYGINNYAVLEQPTSKTTSNSITFNIKTNQIHASGDVNSTIWADEKIEKEKQDPVHLIADDVFIEDEANNIIAKGSKNLVMVKYQETEGESIKAHLTKNLDTGRAEKIIFQGNATVSQPDRELISEEVIFNFQDKALTSNTKTNIRPKTIIFKKEVKIEEKVEPTN